MNCQLGGSPVQPHYLSHYYVKCKIRNSFPFWSNKIVETAAEKEGKSEEKETEAVAEKLSELNVKDEEKKKEGKKKTDSSLEGSDKDTVER